MKIIGVVLVLLGFAGLFFGGVPYQRTENLAQIGDFRMKVTEKKQLALPPVISGAAVLVGAALFFSGRRRPQA